eukprot:SAG11_NODE_3389_length_2479_cov_1.614286_1_plen_437_part_00
MHPVAMRLFGTHLTPAEVEKICVKAILFHDRARENSLQAGVQTGLDLFTSMMLTMQRSDAKEIINDIIDDVGTTLAQMPNKSRAERRDIEHILFDTVDQVAALYMENGSDSPKQRKSNNAKQPVDDASNWQRAQDIAAEAKKSDAAREKNVHMSMKTAEHHVKQGEAAGFDWAALEAACATRDSKRLREILTALDGECVQALSRRHVNAAHIEKWGHLSAAGAFEELRENIAVEYFETHGLVQNKKAINAVVYQTFTGEGDTPLFKLSDMLRTDEQKIGFVKANGDKFYKAIERCAHANNPPVTHATAYTTRARVRFVELYRTVHPYLPKHLLKDELEQCANQKSVGFQLFEEGYPALSTRTTVEMHEKAWNSLFKQMTHRVNTHRRKNMGMINLEEVIKEIAKPGRSERKYMDRINTFHEWGAPHPRCTPKHHHT